MNTTHLEAVLSSLSARIKRRGRKEDPAPELLREFRELLLLSRQPAGQGEMDRLTAALKELRQDFEILKTDLNLRRPTHR